MKLNFNLPILDLENKEIEGTNLGKFLATQLSQSNKGDALKLFGWALKLNAGEIIDLDKSDQTMLKGFIEGSENMTNIVKYRLLEVFETKEKDVQD